MTSGSHLFHPSKLISLFSAFLGIWGRGSKQNMKKFEMGQGGSKVLISLYYITVLIIYWHKNFIRRVVLVEVSSCLTFFRGNLGSFLRGNYPWMYIPTSDFARVLRFWRASVLQIRWPGVKCLIAKLTFLYNFEYWSV